MLRSGALLTVVVTVLLSATARPVLSETWALSVIRVPLGSGRFTVAWKFSTVELPAGTETPVQVILPLANTPGAVIVGVTTVRLESIVSVTLAVTAIELRLVNVMV